MRAAGYVRQSKDKEGSISPDFQRSEIAAHCARKGWTVTHWFEDIDISGRTDQRPGLRALLAGAQDGEFDAVVFYRIDRLSREPAHHYAILAALDEAHVVVDSVGLPSDGTPENAFMWDLSAALAKLESLRLGKRLRSMHKELARQGKYGGNFAPFGWQRVRDPDGQQRLVLLPVEAEWRRRIHQWYQSGMSLRHIARRLNDEGVVTRRAAGWNPQSVQKALIAPVQIGARVIEGERIVTGRIEPLLTVEDFERTLSLRELRRENGFPATGRTPAYGLRAGLVRCGTCGHRMYAYYVAHRGCMVYRCEGYQRTHCEHPASIREPDLRREVEERLFARLRRLESPSKPSKPPEDISPHIAHKRRVEASLGRLAAMYAEGELGEAEYQSARAEQLAKLAHIEARLARAAERIEGAAVTLADSDRARLALLTHELWALLTADEQYAIYRALLARVVVNPTNVRPRIHCQWR